MKEFAVVFVFFVAFMVQSVGFAQGWQKKVVLTWSGVKTIQGMTYKPVKVLYADGLQNSVEKNYTPVYSEKFALPSGIGSCDILISHTEWERVPDTELTALTYAPQPDPLLGHQIEYGTERGTEMAFLTLVPLIESPDGGIMRLKSFTIDVVYIPAVENSKSVKSTSYTAHSALSQGKWYKIQLDETGIYKLSYAEIQAMGVDMGTVTPANIRLFGNSGGLLPELNNIFRFDDLTENAIQVVTAKADVFAPGDYILFYGTSPDKVTYNRLMHRFEHVQNIYSELTYYFLNFDSGAGLRIENQQLSQRSPTYTSTSFTEGIFYEKDILNLINSGKDWVGERMDVNSPVFELPEFTFPHLITSKQSWVRCRVTARASTSNSYEIKVNGSEVASLQCGSFSEYIFASDKIDSRSFYPESDKLKVSFEYNGTGTAIGWLDWVELNVPRELKFTGGQMQFADPVSVMNGAVTEYQLQESSADVIIWEVTNPVKVFRIQADLQGDVSRFVLETDSLRQFVAWDNTSFLSATFAGKVPNQDLHGIETADMLIVTHSDYLEHANRLANHHRSTDGMKVVVATNEQVYNEFSSGSPDIVAIRDFARLLYHSPDAGSKLKYLLLFGDGSFDFKDRVAGNNNRVLTFQRKESLDIVKSWSSDDFYGMLDANEGYDAAGLIDLGIGRFPVSNVEQARLAVDKCISYGSNSTASLGDWRNKIALVADDGDHNLHFRQADKSLAVLFDQKGPAYNVTKVYTDAFKQISTPTGERCPEINAAINSCVETGVLVMNYTGHGGEMGWATESILTVRDIESWTNYSHMPLFITATCEFSRYDNPEKVSAGEYVFLNPHGGGIALFTTTRLASPDPNLRLNWYIYDTLLSKQEGEYPRLGDAITYAKNQFSGGDVTYIRNFILLGDPALRLAYPQYKVVTTEINGQEPGLDPDTISAMTPVQIKGIVTDASDNLLTAFNGVVDVKVYDKSRSLSTLGSDPDDWPEAFLVQDNYIYQGRATVTNGNFSVEFIVPRDIDYSYGFGKISYYAHSDDTDASGFCKQIIIGGSGSESNDNAGPDVSLFINDYSFMDGGLTNDTPLLIAKLSDESGINTMNSGIGHDIVATLDGDNSSSVVLNGYYTSDLDNFRSGEVRYKFPQLAQGKHSLTLKAWDVFNNSSEAVITFTVAKNMQITITSMNVYPNPFKDEVKVGFDINLFDTPFEAYLEIFDINGSLVSSTAKELLLSHEYNAGTLTWNGRTASGTAVVPGIYLISIRVSNSNSSSVKAVRALKVR